MPNDAATATANNEQYARPLYVPRDGSTRERIMGLFPDGIFWAHRENIADALIEAGLVPESDDSGSGGDRG